LGASITWRDYLRNASVSKYVHPYD